jgi:integrase
MARARREHVAHPRHPITGRQVRISAQTDRELSAMLRTIDTYRNELRMGLRSALDVDRMLRRLSHGPTTVERAATQFLARTDIAPNTRRRVRSFLVAAGKSIAARNLDELDGPVLERWIARLQAQGLGGSSIVTSWKTLRQIALYASRRGWIGAAPWGAWKPSRATLAAAGGRRPQREAARGVAELVALFDAARAIDAERELAGLLGDLEAKCASCALLGLRQGELAGLRWPDVRRVERAVAIERQWNGLPTKTRRTYELRALPELFAVYDVLETRLRARDLYDPRGPVFPMRESPPGRPRAYRSGECLTRRDLRAVVDRARLPHSFRWSAHSLRDTFVSLEAGSTHDLSAVAARSRHVSIGSLVRYLRSLSRDPAAPGFSLAPSPVPPALGPGDRTDDTDTPK